MAGQARTIEVSTDAELLQAQADLWRHSLYYLTSMGLRCAIKLGIPTAIHRLGGVTSLPDLMAALSLPASKQPFLGRLMRVLVTSGVFAAGGNDDSESEVELFRLNPLSRIPVDGVMADEHHSQTSFVLAATSPFYTEATLGLADWFKKDVPGPVPSLFEDVHGASLFDESMALLDKELDELVTEGLAAHDNLVTGTIMRECHILFKGLESLTDCCGGDGTTDGKGHHQGPSACQVHRAGPSQGDRQSSFRRGRQLYMSLATCSTPSQSPFPGGHAPSR